MNSAAVAYCTLLLIATLHFLSLHCIVLYVLVATYLLQLEDSIETEVLSAIHGVLH